MTDALFVIGVTVGGLGAPGVWPWVTAAPSRFLDFMAGVS